MCIGTNLLSQNKGHILTFSKPCCMLSIQTNLMKLYIRNYSDVERWIDEQMALDRNEAKLEKSNKHCIASEAK